MYDSLLCQSTKKKKKKKKYKGLTGSKAGQVRFKVSEHINRSKLRKNQYDAFLTFSTDLSMKYK